MKIKDTAGLALRFFILSRIAGTGTYDLMDRSSTAGNPITRSGRLDNLPAGFYLLKLRLRNAVGAYAGRIEVVHIYRNLLTSTNLEDYTFTAEDFTIPNSFIVSNETEWSEALGRIRNGGNDRTYTIYITNSFNIHGSTANTFGFVSGLHVTIVGDHTLSLQAGTQGGLLWIGRGQTLVMRDLSLVGHDSNNISLVNVTGNNNGFVMQGSATVSGNIGGGVRVGVGGTFIMHDNSSVHNNSSEQAGGGVHVHHGTFIMYDNSSVSSNISRIWGGGVNVSREGTFSMHENASVYKNSSLIGGGVHVDHGATFIKSGGTISGNVVNRRENTFSGGGGVSVSGGGTFTMTGGVISGNTVNSDNIGRGGGVLVGYASGGTFSMIGGVISGNTANSGGGVWVGKLIGEGSSAFTMSGGVISGNTANSGGGVRVGHADTGIFTKTGGTITGFESDRVNGNVARSRYGEALSNMGHAVYAYSQGSEVTRHRDFTSGPTLDMLFDARTGVYSGAWEPTLDVTGAIDTISLSWAAFPGATQYIVRRGTRTDNLNYRITIVATEFEDGSNLFQNVIYFYRVYAYNSGVRIARSIPVSGNLVDAFAAPLRSENAIEIVWRGCVFENAGQQVLGAANKITSMLIGIWTGGLATISPSIVLSYRVQRRSEHETDFRTVHESVPRQRSDSLRLGRSYFYYAGNAVAGMWRSVANEGDVSNVRFVDRNVSRGTTYYYRISLTKRFRITASISFLGFGINRTIVDTRITGNVGHGGTHRVFARID